MLKSILGRSSGPTIQVNRVLVGTDRSETAERAVAWAVDMAARYEAELVLVQVLREGDAAATERTKQDLLGHARALAGDRAHAVVLVDTDPARAIVNAARDEKADVVVVGSVGMSGRKEFLLENVPNRVSHNAPCTVVIVDTMGMAKK
jgi:ubiquinone biosynthesis protein